MSRKTPKYRIGFPIDDVGDGWEFVLVRARRQSPSVRYWLGKKSITANLSETGAERAKRAAKAHQLRAKHFEFCHIANHSDGHPLDWQHESDGAACVLALVLQEVDVHCSKHIVLISCECSFGEGDGSFQAIELNNVTPHDNEATRRDSLEKKWRAAVEGKKAGFPIAALVLHEEDANLLKTTLGPVPKLLSGSTFDELVSSDREEPTLVSVGPGQMQLLAQALEVPASCFAPRSTISPAAGEFESGSVEKIQARRHKFWFSLAISTLLLAGSVGAAVRWYVHPPCLPMDMACFWHDAPRFASDEIGILVERNPFSADATLAPGILAELVDDWREELIDAVRKDLPACQPHFPPIRVVAVDGITSEVVHRSGALLGLKGRFEFSRQPETGKSKYNLKNANAILNLRALSSYSYNTVSEIGMVYDRRSTNVIKAVDYRQDKIDITPQVLLSIFGSSSRHPGSREKFKARYPMNGQFTLELTGANGQQTQHPQVRNLNYSLNSEFNYIEDPEPIQPLTVVKLPEVPMEELKSYIIPALLLRFWVDIALPRGIGGTDFPTANLAIWSAGQPSFMSEKSWPPILKSIFLQVRAELRILTLDKFRRELMMNQDYLADPWLQRLRARLETFEWPYMIRQEYADAAKLDRTGCERCYLTMAQLMYVVNDDQQIISDLRSAIEQASGKEKAQLLHTAAKFLISTMDEPDYHRIQEAFEFLHQLSDNGFDAVANFEKARILATLGSSVHHIDDDSPEKLLRRILQKKPKHALSRYLLIRELRHANWRTAPTQEELDLLQSLYDDLLLSHGNYDENLHSLGILDDVKYSVDIGYVLQDLVNYRYARCELDAIRKTIMRARYDSNIDWHHMAGLFRNREITDLLYLFPRQMILASFSLELGTCGMSSMEEYNFRKDLYRMIPTSGKVHN